MKTKFAFCLANIFLAFAYGQSACACCVINENNNILNYSQAEETEKTSAAIPKNKTGRFQFSHSELPRDLFLQSLKYLQAPEFMFEQEAVDKVIVDKEIQYEINVPEQYVPGKPVGVFVFISPGNSGELSDEWYKTLAENNLIAIGPNNSGNRTNDALRFALGPDAVRLLDQAYELDYDRIYVSGFSGGGKAASMMMFGFKEVFSGGLSMGGAIPILKMKIPNAQGKMVDSPKAVNIINKGLDDVKANGRYAFMTGDGDFNNLNAKSVAKGYQEAGFKHVIHIEEADKGHSRPSAETLQKGLDFVDAPLAKLVTERLKTAQKTAEKAPGLAARYCRAAILHAPDKVGESAKTQFDQLMGQYQQALSQLKTEIANLDDKSKTESLEEFARQWLEYATDDLLKISG